MDNWRHENALRSHAIKSSIDETRHVPFERALRPGRPYSGGVKNAYRSMSEVELREGGGEGREGGRAGGREWGI